MRTDDPTADLGSQDTLAGPTGGGAASSTGASYGRFVVVGGLGSGGMGVVLLARDPELDRNVALKLLRPDAGDPRRGDGAARLIREAQAMAKLSHPNVVTVYEVGRAGEQVFIAMELVEGETLRSWMRAARRPWREVLGVFVALGRGLAAAHAAGMVHRDVKPENVLVGRDGRPRITDFGLVAGGIAPEPGAIDRAGLLTGLTIAGAAVGTPGYMSAEQWAGDVVDARSDQFSFCVALWEGVFGARPFAGDTPAEVATQVRAGTITAPPPRHRAPAWLEAALRRGLAVEPSARWPSLSALLDHLEERSAGSRRALRGLAAGGVAVSVGLVVALITPQGDAEACPSPERRAAAVWSPARRGALQDTLVALDPALGQTRFDTAATSFERGVADWRTQHVAACRATRVDGRQSDTMLDQRMRCLDGWLDSVDRAVTALERAADRKDLDAAIARVSNLATPASCADLTVVATPAGTAAQAEARAIEDDLDRLRHAADQGELTDGAARVQQLVERARRLDHPPTLAAALTGAAALLSKMEVPSEELLEELARVAAIAGDDRAAAYAWVSLVRVRGATLDQPEQAEALYASADTALLRAGDPPELRFELNVGRAMVLEDIGRTAEALALLDQAAALIAATDPARLPADLVVYRSRLAFVRGQTLKTAGDGEGSIAAHREAIAMIVDRLGPDHPEVAKAQISLGETLRDLERDDEATAAFQEAVRILEARVGDSVLLATALNRLAYTHWIVEESELAVPLYRRAVAMGDAHLPPDHPRRSMLHTDLATGLIDLGLLDEALAEYTVAIEMDERAGRASTNVALGYGNRASVLNKLGRHDEALADHRRAIAIIDTLGTGRSQLAKMLLSYGHSLLGAGHPDQAIQPLERALPLVPPGTADPTAPLIRFALGRARVESKQDVRGGRAMARAARAEIPEGRLMPETLAEMDGWLKRH